MRKSGATKAAKPIFKAGRFLIKNPEVDKVVSRQMTKAVRARKARKKLLPGELTGSGKNDKAAEMKQAREIMEEDA